jgi:methylated-DNA-[protein]-cysteine S-methyltransferase
VIAPGTFWIDTALGPCGLSFSQVGLTAIALPEPTEREAREVRARIASARTARVPPFVRKAAALLARHLSGKPQDLSPLQLDLSAHPAFRRRVYEAARTIAPGSTVSYGELARALGAPKAARAVGQALAKNPLLLAVPCHRVLGANGKPGGFSAPGGAGQKKRLLALEGVDLARAGGLAEEPRERSADAVIARAARRSGRAGKDAVVPQTPELPSLFRSGGGLAIDSARVVRLLSRKDPALGRAVKLAGPFRMRHSSMHSPFEALATSIVYQQLNGKAAATILSRVVALFAPRAFPRPSDILATADDRLRGAGLSRGKTAAIKDLAAKTLAGVVPPLEQLVSMGDEEIVERLTEVRGIGRWTVEMLLMFRLGRPDVLPATDYGVRKGFARLQGLDELPDPKELLAHGEAWRPFRTVASWYLWRICELPAEVVLRPG